MSLQQKADSKLKLDNFDRQLLYHQQNTIEIKKDFDRQLLELQKKSLEIQKQRDEEQIIWRKLHGFLTLTEAQFINEMKEEIYTACDLKTGETIFLTLMEHDFRLILGEQESLELWVNGRCVPILKMHIYQHGMLASVGIRLANAYSILEEGNLDFYTEYMRREQQKKLTTKQIVAKGISDISSKIHEYPGLQKFMATKIDQCNQTKIGGLTEKDFIQRAKFTEMGVIAERKATGNVCSDHLHFGEYFIEIRATSEEKRRCTLYHNCNWRNPIFSYWGEYINYTKFFAAAAEWRLCKGCLKPLLKKADYVGRLPENEEYCKNCCYTKNVCGICKENAFGPVKKYKHFGVSHTSCYTLKKATKKRRATLLNHINKRQRIS